jgi:large subunit ribosomal protein L6
MSRIGKLPIPIPPGVKVHIQDRVVRVEGPKGKLAYEHGPLVTVAVDDGKLRVTRQDDTRESSSLQGLTRTLLNNMVVGTTKGFTRELDVVGVGYKAELKGKALALSVGKSHVIELPIPGGVDVKIDKNTHIVVTGPDRQVVGQFAANIRRARPPEPYKGKGIKYTEEVVRRKEGKTSA